jgi:hypothetical protein
MWGEGEAGIAEVEPGVLSAVPGVDAEALLLGVKDSGEKACCCRIGRWKAVAVELSNSAVELGSLSLQKLKDIVQPKKREV